MNLVVVAFILLMAYWWALQGLFSAWIHLGCVIVSGALALAMWEPVAHWLLDMPTVANSAWGIALLAPLGVCMLILRIALDRLVPMNLNFPDLANKIGGAVVGAIAAVLTAGLIVMGVLFMPLGENIGGLQPYRVADDGSVTKNDGGTLWVGVDRIAASFYRGLSGGAFYAGNPMATMLPDMAKSAGAFRLHPDSNASLVAIPGAVSTVAAYSQRTPVDFLDPSAMEALGNRLESSGHELLIVDTLWKLEPRGSFDADNTLRLPPSAVRLVVTRGNDETETKEYHPVAISRQERTEARQFIPITTHDTLAISNRREDQFAMIFLVPTGERPRYLYVRQLRLPVPNPESEADAIAAMVGKVGEPEVAPAEDQRRTAVRPREGVRIGAVGIEIANDNRLPVEISRNLASGFQYHSQDQSLIVSGSREVNYVAGVSRALVATGVYEAPGRAIIRLQMDSDRANTIAGQARAQAAAFNPPILRDSFGDMYHPVGYVLLRADRTQVINIDPTSEIRTASQLPLRQMTTGDELYLYFDIGRERGKRLVAFEVGSMKQELDPPLPVE